MSYNVSKEITVRTSGAAGSIDDDSLIRDKNHQMSRRTDDLRVRRTEKLLRDAVLALVEEKGFDHLTVGEITRRAMVSRAAFYRNYRDKYELLERVFEDAIQILASDLSSPHVSIDDPARATSPAPERWLKLFGHFAEYEKLYRVMLGGKGSPWFAKRMRTSLSGMRSARGAAATGGPASSLIDTLFIDTVAWWLEAGMPYPPQQMASYCWRLTVAALKETSTWQVGDHYPPAPR
jgi:AcrR family transcriptional regulator